MSVFPLPLSVFPLPLVVSVFPLPLGVSPLALVVSVFPLPLGVFPLALGVVTRKSEDRESEVPLAHDNVLLGQPLSRRVGRTGDDSSSPPQR